jgi:hypothetical protein
VTTPIPRDEILRIMQNYGDWMSLDTDPPACVIRKITTDYRDDAASLSDREPVRRQLIAEADELDALVDRIEAAA